jgi:hypothetical protein
MCIRVRAKGDATARSRTIRPAGRVTSPLREFKFALHSLVIASCRPFKGHLIRLDLPSPCSFDGESNWVFDRLEEVLL